MTLFESFFKEQKTIIALGLLLVGCSRQPATVLMNDHDVYFPLAVGNTWRLVSTGHRDDSLIVTVLGHEWKYGEVFALVEERYMRGSNKRIVKLWRYSVSHDGNINTLVTVDSESKDTVVTWYKTSVEPGDSWITLTRSILEPASLSKTRITLVSREDTVVANNRILVDCYNYYIDDLSVDDSEYHDWLAKGTGLVKRAYNERVYVLSTFDKKTEVNARDKQ